MGFLTDLGNSKAPDIINQSAITYANLQQMQSQMKLNQINAETSKSYAKINEDRSKREAELFNITKPVAEKEAAIKQEDLEVKYKEMKSGMQPVTEEQINQAGIGGQVLAEEFKQTHPGEQLTNRHVREKLAEIKANPTVVVPAYTKAVAKHQKTITETNAALTELNKQKAVIADKYPELFNEDGSLNETMLNTMVGKDEENFKTISGKIEAMNKQKKEATEISAKFTQEIQVAQGTYNLINNILPKIEEEHGKDWYAKTGLPPATLDLVMKMAAYGDMGPLHELMKDLPKLQTAKPTPSYGELQFKEIKGEWHTGYTDRDTGKWVDTGLANERQIQDHIKAKPDEAAKKIDYEKAKDNVALMIKSFLPTGSQNTMNILMAGGTVGDTQKSIILDEVKKYLSNNTDMVDDWNRNISVVGLPSLQYGRSGNIASDKKPDWGEQGKMKPQTNTKTLPPLEIK